jgi:hypothetical protein
VTNEKFSKVEKYFKRGHILIAFDRNNCHEMIFWECKSFDNIELR